MTWREWVIVVLTLLVRLAVFVGVLSFGLGLAAVNNPERYTSVADWCFALGFASAIVLGSLREVLADRWCLRSIYD